MEKTSPGAIRPTAMPRSVGPLWTTTGVVPAITASRSNCWDGGGVGAVAWPLAGGVKPGGNSGGVGAASGPGGASAAGAWAGTQ